MLAVLAVLAVLSVPSLGLDLDDSISKIEYGQRLEWCSHHALEFIHVVDSMELLFKEMRWVGSK